VTSVGVDDAEPIAFGIGENHIVGIRRTVGLVRARGPKRKQSLDVPSLVFGIQVKVYPRALLNSGWPGAQRDVRTAAPTRPQDCPVIFGRLARHVVQCIGPKRELPRQVIDAKDDRANAHNGHISAGRSSDEMSPCTNRGTVPSIGARSRPRRVPAVRTLAFTVQNRPDRTSASRRFRARRACKGLLLLVQGTTPVRPMQQFHKATVRLNHGVPGARY